MQIEVRQERNARKETVSIEGAATFSQINCKLMRSRRQSKLKKIKLKKARYH